MRLWTVVKGIKQALRSTAVLDRALIAIPIDTTKITSSPHEELS
jgi:hypothetical protein